MDRRHFGKMSFCHSSSQRQEIGAGIGGWIQRQEIGAGIGGWIQRQEIGAGISFD
jgi:hypothetical protein